MNIGWEDLEKIQCDHWKFKDSNRILNNFHSFRISRDDKLRLILEITYKPPKKEALNIIFFNEPERKEGDIYKIDGYLILEDINNKNIT
ncbi:hypothetical protein, partial [Escherichia coli]